MLNDLSKYNTEELRNQIEKVLKDSQDCLFDFTVTEKWLEDYIKAKSYYLDMFDGMIFEYPEKISFSVDNANKSAMICDFIDFWSSDNWNSISRDFTHFLDENIESFFENKVEHPTTYIDSEGNAQTVPAGMKLIKAFKFFIRDDEVLRMAQDKASELIQMNKVEGTLCLSVHPLDYLSLSENTYSWRSCHALDGDYRAGNLSYMFDSSTIVCYLKGADGVKLPRFPQDVLWNSKKWRCLLFLNPNHKTIFAGRQYPFFSDDALKDITKILYSALEINFMDYTPWTNQYIRSGYYNSTNNYTFPRLSNKYYYVEDSIMKDTDLIIDNSTLHYNDLLKSTCYVPYYITDTGRKYLSRKVEPIVVGSNPTCPICNRFKITNSSFMFCNDCTLSYTDVSDNDDICICSSCGAQIFSDEAVVLESGECLCEPCADGEVGYCDSCEGIFYLDDLTIDENDRCLCRYCRP